MRLRIAAVGRLKAGPERELLERYIERVNALGRDLSLAGRLAVFGGLALVDIAGEPIDQPYRLLAGTFHPHESGADGCDQRREQDGRGNQTGADQDRHRIARMIRHDRAIPPILALSFR